MTECQKCLKIFDITETRTLQKCKHVYCCKCLVQYLKYITEPKVNCMQENCKEYLSDRLIRQCLSNDQINAYEQLSLLNCSQMAIKCLTKDCFFIAICEDENIIFECLYCKSPNCVKCKKRHLPNECLRTTNSKNATIRKFLVWIVLLIGLFVVSLTGILILIIILIIVHIETEDPTVSLTNEAEIESRARENLKNRKRKELEELMKEYQLIPSPESFECSTCNTFFLPREGVILKNCLHNFCKECLKSTYKEKRFTNQLKCQFENCKKDLEPGEISELIGEDKLATMIIKEAGPKLFKCKNENCSGVWDVSVETGSYKCHECGLENCIACKDIHENLTCEEFRKTSKYISPEDIQKMIEKNQKIKCFQCNHMLIRKGGCSSMNCDNCGNHTCIFTGKIAGEHKIEECYCNGDGKCPKVELYCGCNSKQLCHKECIYGCYPE